MTITIRDAEFSLFGVQLLVDYTYSEAIPETLENPAEPAEVEFKSIQIADNWEDASDLLESIKVMRGAHSPYRNGYDLLESAILKEHQS